jgi:hypothetical protein
MTTTVDVLAAIDAEGSTSWQLADTLATFDETDDAGKPLTLKVLADRIWKKRGVEWLPSTLSAYRATAIAFPPDDAVSRLHPFTVAKVLRAHPDKLRNWKPKKDGDILTVERAAAMRGSSSAAKATPDAWRGKMKKAFTTIGELAENDPAFTIDMLEQTIAFVRRSYPKQIKRAERELRAV